MTPAGVGLQHRLRPGATVVATLALLVPLTALAQQSTSIEIDGRASCTGCTIELRPVVTLRAPSTADAIGVSSHVARSSRGDFVVSSTTGTSMLVFDSAGHFLRQFGREGDGPGELRRITGLDFGPGDSLHVLTNGRLTVFSPRFEPARQVTLPANVLGSVILASGSLVLRTSARSVPSAALYPVHLFDRIGSLRRSFGIDQLQSSHCGQCDDRTPNPSASGSHVWLTRPNDYILEKWDTAGTLVKRLRITRSPWFEAWTQPSDWMTGVERMRSTIGRMREDADGLLWVAGARAPSTWKPIPGASRGGQFIRRPRAQAETYLLETIPRLHATQLEIIDPVTRRVVASREMPSAGFIGGMYLARTRTDADDELVIDVVLPRLRRP